MKHSYEIDLEVLANRITNAQAKNYAAGRQKAKLSRKLELARQWTKQTASCSETGIVCLIEIPRIHGYSFSYQNPLSILENARGIAQQDYKYLNSLDTQILAGVLITLADDYTLFRYAPSFSGAQKNAILRTCNRSEIINAIQAIEHFVNSANVAYLPQLSFLLDSAHNQNSFESKLQQWVKLLVGAIRKPDLEEYDEEASTATMPRMREIIAATAQVNKQELAATRAKQAQVKQFKADIKLAQTITKELRKNNVLSVKQKAILMDLLDPVVFSTIPTEHIRSIATKLDMMESVEWKDKLTLLSKILIRNIETQTSENDFDLEVSKEDPEQGTIETVSAVTSLEFDEELIEVSGQFFIVDKAEWSALSVMGKIKYKRELLIQAKADNADEKTVDEGDDNEQDA